MARASGPGVRRGVAPRFVAARPLSAPLVVGEPVTLPPDGITPDALPPANVHYTDKFAPVQRVNPVTLTPTTVEDIDMLWDWVRADRDGTTAFLGHAHSTSQSFFHQIGQIAQKEREGTAWMRSIIKDSALVGFVILDPITRTAKPVGTCHIYIAPVVRGELPKLLPSILADGDRQLPNITYFVATQDEAMSALLQAAGFSAQIVLTRASSLGESHGSEGR